MVFLFAVCKKVYTGAARVSQRKTVFNVGGSSIVATAGVNIKINSQGFQSVWVKLERMPDNVRGKFLDEWYVLESHGAQMVDAGFSYGVIWAYISNDFKKHAAKFGVTL